MLQDRARRRFALLFHLLALVLMLAAAFPVHAQQATEDAISDALGQIFKDVLRGSTDDVKTPQTDAVSRTPPGSRNQMMMSFSPLVKATAPAVVNVYADRMVQRRASPFAGDPFFEQFFGQRMPNRTERQSSLGSGVIVEARGIVVTNNHVIEGADDIRVALADGREFESRLLLKDERFDLAILAIDGAGPFPVIEFGDTDAIEVGDIVLAIGNPFGVGQTVTSGIVSALARNRVGVSDFGFFIQTDAAINPGNSGGALIDMNGRLIGINTAIFTRSGGSNGIGFAIPANLVRAVAQTAESGGEVFERPYIGATFASVTADIAEALGLKRATGALVTDVAENGPSADSGLRAGDIIIGFNGQPIEHPDALGYRLATAGVGASADFTVLSRDGRKTVTVKLVAPPADDPRDRRTLDGRNPFAGAVVSNITPRIADQLRLPVSLRGVIITEVPRQSLAGRYGFRPGDVISDINSVAIPDVDILAGILDEGASFWRFEIIRDGRRIRQMIR
ncbi:periplasmic serine protease, Do/DeqQ family [Hoeflea phototrophica DFL-43]|jgi:Do/DeqQ family serine protease|uniref:Periplasmic serine protease, Do/DeqQ family n=1 Tax=Hoeflea phototrophica (strain DSM 17068 / NCIMB 14078 / DFL-43) TaxID=411684 RepID=A9DCM5_HOEPD|nr:periplasmic serine protease, Do/DeqQ family [Hoeflea phototrophica DFL-43]